MANKLPRKALIAVSSFNGAIYPEGHKTGVFFVGCVVAAAAVIYLGDWAWSIPAALSAAAIALP